MEDFRELFEFIKEENVTLEDVLRQFGGGEAIYIPTLKTFTCKMVKEKILNDYISGMTQKDLMKKYRGTGVSRSFVRGIIKEYIENKRR